MCFSGSLLNLKSGFPKIDPSEFLGLPFYQQNLTEWTFSRQDQGRVNFESVFQSSLQKAMLNKLTRPSRLRDYNP